MRLKSHLSQYPSGQGCGAICIRHAQIAEGGRMMMMRRRRRKMTTTIEVKKPPLSSFRSRLWCNVQYALCMRRLQRQGGFFLSNAAFISEKVHPRSDQFLVQPSFTRINFWFGQFSLGPLFAGLIFTQATMMTKMMTKIQTL